MDGKSFATTSVQVRAHSLFRHRIRVRFPHQTRCRLPAPDLQPVGHAPARGAAGKSAPTAASPALTVGFEQRVGALWAVPGVLELKRVIP